MSEQSSTADHPVLQRVQRVQRKARGYLLSTAFGKFITVVLLVIAALALFDYLIRYHDRGIRVIVSTLALGVAIVSFWRYIYPAIRRQLSVVLVAQRIEEHFPELEDRLSTAVHFLNGHSADAVTGSHELQATVIEQAARRTQRLDLSDCLNRDNWRRQMLVAAIVLAGAAGLWAFDPSSASLAAQRLLLPWSERNWPRTHELALRDAPQRVAIGADFEIEIIDRNGKLPDEVELQIRYLDPSYDPESRSLRLGRDGRMFGRIDNIRTPLEYRAIGGDDDRMPWQSLEVVAPAAIETVELHLSPPAYSGLAARRSGPRIRALVGTTIAVEARCTKRLSSATLCIQTGDDSEVHRIALKLDADHRGFSSPADHDQVWTVQEPGTYWFEWTDEDELAASDDHRYRIHAIDDNPPTLFLQEPADNQLATPNALLRIAGYAQDDLKLRSVRLSVQVAEEASDADQDNIPTTELITRETPTNVDAIRGDRAEISHDWDLSHSVHPKIGDVLNIVVSTEDFHLQSSANDLRRVRIVSATEMQQHVAQFQTEILAKLQDALDTQREVHRQTGDLHEHLKQASRVKQDDFDALQADELGQSRIAAILSEGDESVASRTEWLLQTVRRNRLDTPDLQRKLQRIVTSIGKLTRDELPAVQQSLRELLADLRQQRVQANADAESHDAPLPAGMTDTLSSTASQQQQIAYTLQSLIDQLRQWNDYQQFARDIRQIQAEHRRIAEQTRTAQATLFGRDLRELSSDARSELQRLADQQLELTRRIEKVLSRMQTMSQQQSDSDPLMVETLREAHAVAMRLGLGEQMRLAASAIQYNRAGEAATRHEQIIAGLDELLDALANKREHELNRLTPKLKEAAAELKRLRKRVTELAEQAASLSGTRDPLAPQEQRKFERLQKSQREAVEQAKHLSRQLRRLNSEHAGDAVAQAALHLQRASDAARDRDAATVQDGNRLAQELLDLADQQLQKTVQQTKRDLTAEQVSRLRTEVQDLAARQRSVLEVTVQLHGQRNTDGSLSEEDARTAANWAQTQRLLRKDTISLANSLTDFAVFRWSLMDAAEQMQQIADWLEAGKTGIQTQAVEKLVLERLEQIAASVTPDKQPQPNPPKGNGDQSPSTGPKPPDDGNGRLAELKLLLAMQRGLNRQTVDIHRMRQDRGVLDESQKQTLQILEGKQRQLADLLSELTTGS